MRERMNANGAGDTTSERDCGREEELLAYLYGESAHEESTDFRRHLADCAACGEELAAFGGVREGLGEWREEVMRSIPALNISGRALNAAGSAAPVASDASALKTETRAPEFKQAKEYAHPHARTRSASAALREFFSLSPLWLRVGTAAASVLLCTLAALILARAEVRWDSNGFAFDTGVKERVIVKQIEVPTPSGFTREQVDALVRQNVEREVAAVRARWEADEATRAGAVNAGGVNARGGERRASSSRNSDGTTAVKEQPSPRRPRRGAANGELLAEENGDVFYPDEESVPRLTDILGAVKSPVKNER